MNVGKMRRNAGVSRLQMGSLSGTSGGRIGRIGSMRRFAAGVLRRIARKRTADLNGEQGKQRA